MKTFKQFLEDYSVGGGLTPKQMLGPGTQWFRTPAEKMKENQRFIRVAPGFIPNWLQAKLSRDDKINGQYKDVTNPKKPSEKDLINGTIPVKKA